MCIHKILLCEVKMEPMAKGKLSYYVLSCLAERDMYGLELIEEIKKKFDIDIKLPSLYSNLNRMKELKYISNYLKDSNEGPKRSYSSITVKGREELENLKQSFGDFDDNSPAPTKVDEPEEVEENSKEDEELEIKENDDDYDEYFDIPEESSSAEIEDIQQETDVEEEKQEEIAEEEPFDDESVETVAVDEPDDIKEEEFFTNEEEGKPAVDEYAQYTENKRLFDITQDFSKYRKKKSFTENQIVMNVSTSQSPDPEKQQNDVDSLKKTIENSRDGNYEPIDRFAGKEEEEQKVAPIELSNEYEKFNQETKDDGLFITDRVPVNEIPKAKKIEMSKLSFTIPSDYSKLPAPHRNSSLDPTHSDVKARLQKLYEKASTDSNKEQTKYREYETFEELKEYYDSQDIEFKIYNKPKTRVFHNTNKLLFLSELIVFFIVGLGSLGLYFLFNSFDGVNMDLSFLYYLFPIISLVFLVYKIYNYKFGISRLPKSMLNPIILWAIFLLGSIAIFCFSIICGLSLVNPVTYCTCIIYPIFVYGIWLVARYYITIGLYKKYWK